MKTVKIQGTRPSVPGHGDTSKASASSCSIWGGDPGVTRNLAPGSPSTGSPAGRAPLLIKPGNGSMYSQANVRAGKVLRPPIRALPSVIVDTEKVLREADGPVEMSALTLPSGGNVIAPGCAWKRSKSPKIISGTH